MMGQDVWLITAKRFRIYKQKKKVLYLLTTRWYCAKILKVASVHGCRKTYYVLNALLQHCRDIASHSF